MRFNNQVYVDENRYFPVMVISIGKENEKDYKSVRLLTEDIIFLR
jgi:hypothetical protein